MTENNNKSNISILIKYARKSYIPFIWLNNKIKIDKYDIDEEKYRYNEFSEYVNKKIAENNNFNFNQITYQPEQNKIFDDDLITNVENINKIPMNIPGIYYFYIKKKLMYVGKSKTCVKSRIRDHLRNSLKIQNNKITSIKIKKLCNLNYLYLLLIEEQKEIKKYSPLWNDIGNPNLKIPLKHYKKNFLPEYLINNIKKDDYPTICFPEDFLTEEQIKQKKEVEKIQYEEYMTSCMEAAFFKNKVIK